MKLVLSVSKKHGRAWRIYFYEQDQDGNLVFQSKKISKWLIPFYKMQKYQMAEGLCPECRRTFTVFTNWLHRKNPNCPYCD